MIHPLRARSDFAISSDLGNALPLEDASLELLGRSAGAIEIVGGPGSGKTTALAHLAAVIPANYKAVFLDEPPLASVIEKLRIPQPWSSPLRFFRYLCRGRSAIVWRLGVGMI